MGKRTTKQHAQLRNEVLSDPVMRNEYELFKLQLTLAEQLKKARKKAHLSQAQVASEMATKKPVIARLEAAGGKGRHAPSIRTLYKYAKATGCKLSIRLTPQKNT